MKHFFLGCADFGLWGKSHFTIEETKWPTMRVGHM